MLLANPRYAPRRADVMLAAIVIAAALVAPARAQAGDDDERFVVVRAARVITISGKDVEGGMIVLANGKIRNVGRDIEYPRNSRVFDAGRWVVMPGLINPHSRHGLTGYQRTGVQGQLGATDEYILSDGDMDELVKAGYTAVALTPLGNGIPGTAMIVRTGGPSDQRVLDESAYLKVLADKMTLRGAFERAQAEIDKVEKAKKEFEDKQKAAASQPASAPASGPASQPTSQPASAPASQPAFQPPPIDPSHQPLVNLIHKKEGARCLVELTTASDLLHLNQVFEKYDVERDFLIRNSGFAANFNYVVETLGERKSRVVAYPTEDRLPNSVIRNPLHRDLTHAGCELTTIPLNDSGTEHLNVMSRLASLVRDGWSREEAMKSVTLHPARLLGLEKRLGTIEKDREGDFTFYDRDPLDPTARVMAVMIAGEVVYVAEEFE